MRTRLYEGWTEIDRELVQRIVATATAPRATLDLDATLIESHKR